jgi:Tfp pilus assembly protein PilV
MTVQHRKSSRYSSGQALAELIIACAILAITLFGVVATINFAVTTVALSTNKTRANYYAQEGLEQARAARNTEWSTFVNGAYLGSAHNVWTPIAGTIFSRRVTIADAGLAGNNDAQVTSHVTWFDGTRQYETRLVTVLTNR